MKQNWRDGGGIRGEGETKNKQNKEQNKTTKK